MSRSCQSATFSSAALALPRSTRARPLIRSTVIGLRLWGIDEEPFCWPERNGSAASSTSVRWRWRISVARRSRPAPASAIAPSSAAWRSRATTWVEMSSRRSPRRSSTRCSNWGEAAEYVPTAPDRLPTATPSKAAVEALGVAVRLEGEARELDAEGRRLGVDAVGAPDAERALVLAGRGDQHRDELAGAGQDDLADRAQLQRERRVEHVRGGQAVVDPAPARARGGREHVDEGGDVVVGDALALGDRLDREGRGADRLEVGGGRPLGLLGGGDLDLAPELHARGVGPQGADLRAGVAGDHAPGGSWRLRVRRAQATDSGQLPPESMIRTASSAALRALSSPTAATGTPGRHLDHREDRVEPAGRLQAARERHADHGKVGVGGDHARQRGREAGAGDQHAQAAGAGGLGVLGDEVGLAVRRHHVYLVGDAALAELLGGALHRVHVAGGAHHDADQRRRLAGLLGDHGELGLGAQRSLALSRAAMSRRSWRPGNSTMSAAAYAASRALCASAPSAVMFSTRPPAVTSSPSRRAVPAWVTSTSAGSAVETADHVAAGARLGVAGACEHDGDRPLRRPFEPGAGEAAGARGGEQRVEQVRAQPRQQRLRLGVAEADVELDHLRPVRGQHQAAVEDAVKRRAALAHQVDDRLVDRRRRARRRARRRPRRPGSRSPCRRCWGRGRRRRSACSRAPGPSRSRARRRRARAARAHRPRGAPRPRPPACRSGARRGMRAAPRARRPRRRRSRRPCRPPGRRPSAPPGSARSRRAPARRCSRASTRRSARRPAPSPAWRTPWSPPGARRRRSARTRRCRARSGGRRDPRPAATSGPTTTRSGRSRCGERGQGRRCRRRRRRSGARPRRCRRCRARRAARGAGASGRGRGRSRARGRRSRRRGFAERTRGGVLSDLGGGRDAGHPGPACLSSDTAECP